MQTHKISLLTIFVLACRLYADADQHQASPSFFRHDGGVADNAGTLPHKLDSGNQRFWRIEIPSGQSTPCLWQEHIFLTGFRAAEKQLVTLAVDLNTGKILWERVAPADRIESVHRIGNPAVSTPACDDRRVYVYFGSFGMLCYDFAGKPIWETPMGPFQDEFGAASSPVLAEGILVLNQDHDIENFLMGIDAATGKRLWKTPRPDATRSYSSPVVKKINGSWQAVVAGALELSGYDLHDGSRLWWVDGLARIVIPTPVFDEATCYVASWSPGGDTGSRLAMDPWPEAIARWDPDGDGRIRRADLPEGPVTSRFFRIDLDQDGSLDEQEWNRHAAVFRRAQNAVLAVQLGGRGNLTDSAVSWKYSRGIPYVSSPLLHKDILYMVKNGGILTSMRASDGRVLKQARLPGQGDYFASPVAGDGKVYLASVPGKVSIVTDEGDWSLITSHDFDERIFATPVLAKGKILIRTEKALYCFGANQIADR